MTEKEDLIEICSSRAAASASVIFLIGDSVESKCWAGKDLSKSHILSMYLNQY